MPESKKSIYAIGAALLVAVGLWTLRSEPDLDLDDICVQYPVIEPSHHFNSSSQFADKNYVKLSAELLSGAVQIPTESFDDMDHDPLAEPRLKIFHKLHKYLDTQFPRCAEYKETVNTYGLLYTITGSDASLEPILYMAHQDVVPVNHETWGQWDHEPFSGYYDGEWLYGRGSGDTKNTVIAQLEAVESLLAQGWAPKRTLLLSYGFDEECDGKRGAGHLAPVIESRYGTHGVKLIIDEGDGLEQRGDLFFASPAVAEKGIVDFNIEMLTPGGHSSVPPDHTGIGILAKLATVLEAHPFTAEIEEESIFTEIFGCYGRWDTSLDSSTKSVFTSLDKKSSRTKLAKMLDSKRETRYLTRTSQAIDVINGGVKVNALPEKVTMQVDHRIAVHESIEYLGERLCGFVKDLCKEFDIGAEFNGQVIAEGGHSGLFNITSFGGYDPAPISPTSGEIWASIGGVTKHIFKDSILAPSIMIGNTDTGNYWNVSRNIYRYNPCYSADTANIHTVNEKLRFRSHIHAVQWFYEFTIHWTV